MRRRIFFTTIFLLIAGTSAAHAGGDVSVLAGVNKKTITIGDRIIYDLEVTAARGAEIQMPEFKDGSIGEFEIKDFSRKVTDHLFGRRTIRNRYVITAYSVGKKDIPQVEVKYKLKPSGDWVSKKTPALVITVQSVLPKEMPADIRDIKAPAHFFEINWFLVAGIILLLVVLIGSVVAYRRISQRKPVRLPHETALEELESARAQLQRGGDLKEYFVGVSDCIRRYIERVIKLKAPEMTSEEFLNSLKDSTALSIPQKGLLKGFMNACDMVKFAKYMPTSSETENLYDTAKNFVEETKEKK